MHRHPLKLAFIAAMACVLCSPAIRAGEAEEKAALAKNAEAFIEAFHKGDATAVAGFWAEDGDYVDQSGRHLKGRAAIEAAMKAFFANNKGLKLRIESDSLRFITPDVAVEEGTTFVFPPDGSAPSRARYQNTHVKKGGKWQLASVRDSAYAPPSNYEKLRGLEWTIGQWASEGDKGPIERLAVAWGEQQNFLHASFMTTIGNVSVGNVVQWIGWDPDAKQVRSWMFDVTGGFGEGTWSQDGNKWTIKTRSTQQNGAKTAATLILTSVDADTMTLQAKDRTLDGKAVPDLKEVKLKRVK